MNIHHGLISAGRARRILLSGEGEKAGRYLLRHVSNGTNVISAVKDNDDKVIYHYVIPSKETQIVKKNPHIVTLSEKVC